MFDLDKFEEIFSTIKKNKLRTFLTGFSVAWGIFMLIILLGSGQGLENGFENQFSSSAKNAIWMWSGQTSMPYKGMNSGRDIRLTNDDYSLIRDQIGGVEDISARYNMWNITSISYKNEYGSFDVRNVHPDYSEIEKIKMVEGRFVNHTDIDKFRKVAIISTVVQDELFKNEDKKAMGKYVQINGVPFQVVGIYEDKDNREDNMRVIYLPVSTAQKVFTGGNRVHQISLTIDAETVEESKAIEDNIRKKMASIHSFDENDKRAVGMWNSFESYMETMNITKGIRLFIWIIGIGTIVAGVVGVSNIMMIVVKERTREIGIRKALGATPMSIISLIMTESVLITTIAGYIGLVLGISLLELAGKNIDSDFFSRPEADFGVAISATILLIVSGALAGFFPARKATAIKPIDALRDE